MGNNSYRHFTFFPDGPKNIRRLDWERLWLSATVETDEVKDSENKWDDSFFFHDSAIFINKLFIYFLKTTVKRQLTYPDDEFDLVAELHGGLKPSGKRVTARLTQMDNKTDSHRARQSHLFPERGLGFWERPTLFAALSVPRGWHGYTGRWQSEGKWDPVSW